jgi:hypothetical protein
MAIIVHIAFFFLPQIFVFLIVIVMFVIYTRRPPRALERLEFVCERVRFRFHISL